MPLAIISGSRLYGWTPPAQETDLQTLAASLSAGSSSTSLGDNDLGATIRATWQWASVFHYDHDNSRAHLLGKNASGQGSERSNCQYDAATNTWTGTVYGGSELGHVYDSIAYDPAAGDLYTGTWASEAIKKWTFGAALDTWTDPVSTSTQELTSGVQPAMCWHPNLFGSGDGGLVVMSEATGGGTGRLVAWRKSTDAWSVIADTSHAVSSYPMRGGMCYVPTGDYVIAAFTPSVGGNTYTVPAGSGGSLGAVSTIDDVPISCFANDEGSNVGVLLADPSGANGAYILEKLGTSRVWKKNGAAWDLQGFTHPLESSNGFWIVASCDPLGVFMRMAQDSATSKVWKPDG